MSYGAQSDAIRVFLARPTCVVCLVTVRDVSGYRLGVRVYFKLRGDDEKLDGDKNTRNYYIYFKFVVGVIMSRGAQSGAI